MSTLQVVPSKESDRELIRLYLENRRDMDYGERKMFLEYIALILKPPVVMAWEDVAMEAKIVS